MRRILKTDPAVFQAVIDGIKTYEIRFNDRGYDIGDELLLRETTHTGAEIAAGAPLVYTGREVTKTVSHVLSGYGLAERWVILSFAAATSPQQLFGELVMASDGSERHQQLLEKIMSALTEYVGESILADGAAHPQALDEGGALFRSPGPVPVPVPAADEGEPALTRYDLYTVTHERRIKPMPDGRYYLASDADQRLARAVAAAREEGQSASASAPDGLSQSIDTPRFRELVHAYAAYPADIRPLVSFVEKYKTDAVASAVKLLSNEIGTDAQQLREAGKQEMLDQVGALFGVGRDARNWGVIETNYRNLVRRTECLGAIEREFFMVPGEPDDDAPGIEPDDECLLNWGAAPAAYVEQFRAALVAQFAPTSSASLPTEAWATLDDNGKLFHATCFSVEAAQHAQNGRTLVALVRRPVESKAAAALGARKLPDDLAHAICRVSRDRGLGLAIGPVREFLARHGHAKAEAPCARELSIGDEVEVLPGCEAGDEDFSGRRGVVQGFNTDGMTGVDVAFAEGGGVFCMRDQLEFIASAPKDPLLMPLPCDIKVGNATHRKGSTLLSLVARMHTLYALADSAGLKSYHYDAEHPEDGLNAPGAAAIEAPAGLMLHLAIAQAEQVLPAGHCITIEVQRGRSGVDWSGPGGLVFMNACGSLTQAVREATRAAVEAKRA
jgi:hypothetical protein